MADKINAGKNVVIVRDGPGWYVADEVEIKTGKNAGTMDRRSHAYYGKLENIADHLLTRCIDTPDGDTVLEQVRQLRIDIEVAKVDILEALREAANG